MIRRFPLPENPHQSFLGEPPQKPLSLATPVHKPTFGVRPAGHDVHQLQAALRKLRER